jgi:ubiquinone biosynthesis protein
MGWVRHNGGMGESAAPFAGSFLEPTPWPVDPAAMPWRRGIDDVRRSAAASVPTLLQPPRRPPLRFLHVVGTVAATSLPTIVTSRIGKRDAAEQRLLLARRMLGGFVHLGVTFVKLAQVLSSAEGMLPDELVRTFARCRDQAAPEDFGHVRSVVEEDLGRPLEDVFASFDRSPLAAASIAQVHAATLVTGEEVVVKVQRPGLRRIVEADISAMTWLIHFTEQRNPGMKVFNLGAFVELFAETIVEELDFRLEAQNMLDIAEVLAESAGHRVVVPCPHPELVTERVLVMQRLHGHKVDDETALAGVGADAAAVLEALLISFFEGSLVHGVFHGDMHGGNMLVAHDGTPVLLDLGMTGRFTPEARPHLVRLLLSPSDAARAKLESFAALGGFPPGTDLDRIEQLLEEARKNKEEDDKRKAAPAAGTGDGEPQPDMAHDTQRLFQDLVGLGARLPKELFLFVKGLLYLNGATAALGGNIDLSAAFGSIALHFAEHHAARLTDEAGVDAEKVRADAAAAQEQMRKDHGKQDGERVTFADVRRAREQRD